MKKETKNNKNERIVTETRKGTNEANYEDEERRSGKKELQEKYGEK